MYEKYIEFCLVHNVYTRALLSYKEQDPTFTQVYVQSKFREDLQLTKYII